MEDKNIVKEACKELNITQAELANIMGVNDVTVRSWSSKGNISDIGKNFINHLLKSKSNECKLNKFKKAFSLIDEAKK